MTVNLYDVNDSFSVLLHLLLCLSRSSKEISASTFSFATNIELMTFKLDFDGSTGPGRANKIRSYIQYAIGLQLSVEKVH